MHIQGIDDITDKIEPIYMTKHVCNRAREEEVKKMEAELKEKKEDEGSEPELTEEQRRREEDILVRMDVIRAHDRCLAENLKKLTEKYKETQEEKEKREKAMAKRIE